MLPTRAPELRLAYPDDHDSVSGSGQPSPRVTVLLIDPATLTRDCLAALLASSAPDFDVVSVPALQQLPALQQVDAAAPDVVLLNRIGEEYDDERIQDELQYLDRLHPLVPVLVIREQGEPLATWNPLRPALRGTFPASLGTTLLIATIRLVLATRNGARGA
jgi:DNA-binding NarL/FixJ family response regulator